MHGEGVFYWNDGKKYKGNIYFFHNKVNIKMIKKTDMVNFIGLMVEYIKDNGQMVYSMVKVF